MSFRYYAVTLEEGAAKFHVFKEWFRATQNVPNASQMTTHRMRDYLKRKGWQVREDGDRVLIIEPGAENFIEVAPDSDTMSALASESASAESSLFALESHLRDYLAKNLNATVKFGSPLSVIGVEYSTDVGPIDLLAQNAGGDYYVFELKLDRGADAALGQLLRYMGWCAKNLSNGRPVHGVILASEISDKLRYAATQVSNITLLEYELQMRVHPVAKI